MKKYRLSRAWNMLRRLNAQLSSRLVQRRTLELMRLFIQSLKDFISRLLLNNKMKEKMTLNKEIPLKLIELIINRIKQLRKVMEGVNVEVISFY